MRARMIAGSAAGLLGLAALATPAAADGHLAQLSVLHGVPGLTVDVRVNGERTLGDVEPGDLAGPLELPEGTYSVAITAADDGSPAIGPVDLPLRAGASYTAVAHLDGAGSPTASLFTNDTSATAAGEGRLTVRHAAEAPAVDVLAGGSPVVSSLENSTEQVMDLPAGSVGVAVAAAGTVNPLIGPADVHVAEGVNTIVYAWGSLSDGNLDLAVQTIDGLHSSPAGVPTAQARLVSDPVGPSVPAWSYAFVAVGMALLIALIGRTRTRKPATPRR